jgi:hypothetical protein
MMAKPASYLKVAVTCQLREDGGLRIWSDDVPGLLLSGPDPDAVLADVIPALAALFKHNRGMDVQFGPLGTADMVDAPALPIANHEIREYAAPVEIHP